MPTDGRNLIIKAADMLRKSYGVSSGVAIHLTKVIPSPGGLGGGSSNAAVALLGLRNLWNLRVSDEELKRMAATLGSDVPFFLQGGTAIGRGRGEIIEQAADVTFAIMLIVTPNVHVSTPAAFANLRLDALTTSDLDNILSDWQIDAETLDTRPQHLINDFESSIFKAHLEISRVKKTLLELGAVNAAMSGSGGSVFAIFDNTETRQIALNALAIERDWRTFAVATVSRLEYRDALQ